MTEELPAKKAEEWGLVNWAVPAAELDAKTDEVVENLARKLPQTTRYAKQHLNFWRDLAWHETINHARDWLALSMATDEPKAAIEKFLEAEMSDASSSSNATAPIATVLLNRPKQLNALSDELMGALVDALRELDARRRRSGASSSAAPSAPSRPAPTSRQLAQASPIEMYYQRRDRPLGSDPGALDAPRGRGFRLLPRRRLRAGDGVRPDRRLRDGEVRPAGDRPRDHPGRRRHAAPDACRREGAGDGRDPERAFPLGGEALAGGLVARVVAQEAWLDEAKRVARDIAVEGAGGEPPREGGGRPRLRGRRSRSESSTSGGCSTWRSPRRTPRKGLTAFLEKRSPGVQREVAMPNVDELLKGARDAITVKRVYGDPIEATASRSCPQPSFGAAEAEAATTRATAAAASACSDGRPARG